MKVKPRILGLFIAVFTIFIAVLLFLFVRNNIPKDKIIYKKLKETKKNIHIQILRYENDIFSLDVNQLTKEVEHLSKKYPPFFIEKGIWNDKKWMESLKAYLQDTVMIALYHEVKKTIKTEQLFIELENAFSYYKIFYPHDSIPLIITMIPGLDIYMPSVYLYNNVLIVNVDMYLGADYKFYKKIEGLHSYITERCEPVYIPIDVFKKAMVYKHLKKELRTTLLETMISEGKKLFFTEMMFPQCDERFIIGYSEEKYKWANEYLGNAYSYMIEKNELFVKGEALIRCYVEESPFTKPFGYDSPGRMGIFIGWKLIQSYMKNNPDVTLDELMQNIDYQSIFKESKFKPKSK